MVNTNGVSFAIFRKNIPVEANIYSTKLAVLKVHLTTHQRYPTLRASNVHLITGHQGPRGGVELQLYSFSSLAIEPGGMTAPRPGRFNPGKTRYVLYRRLGGPQVQSGRVRKISPPQRFDPGTVRSPPLHQLSYRAHTLRVSESNGGTHYLHVITY
jgi:rRNA maturation protein Nop10